MTSFETGSAQPVQVNEPGYLLEINRVKVGIYDQSLFFSFGQWQAVNFAGVISLIDEAHDFGGDLIRGAGAVLVLVFKAVPDAGVVAGGDDDGAAGFLRQDAVAYHGRGRGFGAEVDLDAVAGNHLGGGGGKVLGGKAGVIADNDAASGQLACLR